MPLLPKLDLCDFPRCRLLESASPIQFLPRLSHLLGGPQIYVKRDDIGGLGGGGNKLRKLEFLLGEALAQGADTIITVGGLQSNHARLTAAAAAQAGLACELVLTSMVPRKEEAYVHSGNVLLNELFGARMHDLPGGTDAMAFATQRAEELRKAGHKAYLAPLGGSSAVGCLGYVAAAAEILQQEQDAGLEFDHIVLPNGSGGTQAGLVVGLLLQGRNPQRVVAHTVLAPAQSALASTTAKIEETLALLRNTAPAPNGAVVIREEQLGEGYGIPTDAMREVVRLMASVEGLLLDPVYGGKAFAGLLQDIREKRFEPQSRVLFLMTGGLPSLFAYRSVF